MIKVIVMKQFLKAIQIAVVMAVQIIFLDRDTTFKSLLLKNSTFTKNAVFSLHFHCNYLQCVHYDNSWGKANLCLSKLNSMFHHLPSVGPKQLCPLAHLGYTAMRVLRSKRLKQKLLKGKDSATIMGWSSTNWLGPIKNNTKTK